MAQEVTERTFSTGDIARLELTNIRGTVTIQGGFPEVRITAVKHLNSGSAEDTEIIIEQDRDGEIIVDTRFPPTTGWLSGRKPCKVDYRVEMPANVVVSVKTVTCEQTLSDLRGSVRVKTVSGSITSSGLEGDLDFKTVSGSIRGERLSGKLKYDTVSGSVHIIQSDLHEINGKTVSGGTVLGTRLLDGPYEFNTVSGSLHFSLPEAQGLTVELKSVSGQIKSAGGTSSSMFNPGRKRSEFWGGGPLVRVKSVSGNVEVEPAGNEPVYQTDPVDTGRDRMEILDDIESGKISVEEALRLLDS